MSGVTEPGAFFSYAHADDDRAGRALSVFYQLLADELRLQTGGPFPLFRDREELAWGQAWRQRVDDAMDSASLLVAVVSPSYLASAECRRELACFLDLERRLGRQDLVLPVLWINVPIFGGGAAQSGDDLARELAGRQHADWRDLRFDVLPAAGGSHRPHRPDEQLRLLPGRHPARHQR